MIPPTLLLAPLLNTLLTASVVVPALPPTTTDEPPACKLNTVPETVIAAPPAANVCEPIRYFVCPAAAAEFASTSVEVPITRVPPLEASEMVVPESVIAEPGIRVWVPRTNALAELAVTVAPAIVAMAGVEAAGEGIVARSWVARA